MLRRLWTLIPALLVSVAACSHGPAGDEPQPIDRPVRVEARNNYALPVDLYAVGSGITHRLGTVNPGLSASFTIPPNLLAGNGVELQARTSPTDPGFSSEELLLAPGTVVDFLIAPQLFSSTVTLR
jgi:hypothetical protein